MNGYKVVERSPDIYLTEMFWARNDDAISEADKKYHGLLFSIILTVLKNDRDAEECLNDVYLKIWESIPPNRPSSFRAYAVKIARNTAMNIFRKNGAEKRTAGRAFEIFDEGNRADFEYYGDEEQALRIREILNSYLTSADERKTYIFMSRYYFNKPISEISVALRCSESTVHKEIRKIKNELRKKLEEGGIYV